MQNNAEAKLFETIDEKRRIAKESFEYTRSNEASKAAYDLLKTSGQTALLVNGAAATAVTALLTKEHVPLRLMVQIPRAIIAYATGVFFSTVMLYFAMLCADYWNAYWYHMAYDQALANADAREKDADRNERLSHVSFWLAIIAFICGSAFVASGVTKLT